MNYAYGGNCTIKLLFPHICGKCDYPMGSSGCTSAPSGYVGKARIKDDPKFITEPFHKTVAFEKLYNQRTSTVRTFKYLKNNYNLDNYTLIITP